MLKGFTIRENIGIGDKIQFTSLPENYFRATGDKLVDVSKCWVFDHNPFVLRDLKPDKTWELWNFPKQYDYPLPRRCINGPMVYTCNAEIWAGLFGVPVVLNRPRLYIHEDYHYSWRFHILYHHSGKSHGELPEQIAKHVLAKYENVRLIGLNQPDLNVPKIDTPDIWTLVDWISRSRMLISVDSGPCWIGACYPDVIVKRIRNRPVHGERHYDEWVPLEIDNIHSHWDDPLFLNYHAFSEDDIGPFMSWKKI